MKRQGSEYPAQVKLRNGDVLPIGVDVVRGEPLPYPIREPSE